MIPLTSMFRCFFSPDALGTPPFGTLLSLEVQDRWRMRCAVPSFKRRTACRPPVDFPWGKIGKNIGNTGIFVHFCWGTKDSCWKLNRTLVTFTPYGLLKHLILIRFALILLLRWLFQGWDVSLIETLRSCSGSRLVMIWCWRAPRPPVKEWNDMKRWHLEIEVSQAKECTKKTPDELEMRETQKRKIIEHLYLSPPNVY